MKKIEQISFNEMLLIPAKEKFEGDLPLSHYCGFIKGEEGEGNTPPVHVMLFNCIEPEEIISLIKEEITSLTEYFKQNPWMKEIPYQINFFSRLEEEVENSLFPHKPSEELIEFFNRTNSCKLDKNKVIFLNGVSSLVER